MFFVFFGLSTDPADMPPVLLPALGLAVLTADQGADRLHGGRGPASPCPAGCGPGGADAARRVLGRHRRARGGVRGRAGLAPLATAYVLITVVSGPLLARLPDYAWFKTMIRKRIPLPGPPPPLTAQD